MRGVGHGFGWATICAALAVASCDGGRGGRGAAPLATGDEPAIATHLDQDEIEAGGVALDVLIERGASLFAASFNDLDGAGRPETTGTGAPRTRREAPENFNRISAPDSNSCAGCHNSPRAGGGGDNVANVFVLGQRLPFVNFDGGAGDDFMDHDLDNVANERNTLGMFGAGFVELLAREMSADLQVIRAEAVAAAAAAGAAVVRDLETKGVRFGRITAFADGSVDTGEIEGVDADLVVKPFHQKGVVVSLREFTNNAYNHHHGMQSAERFGAGADPDADGHVDELTAGDITAATLFQATLPVPGRVMPADPTTRAVVLRGEGLFESVGCTVCHVPALRLNDPVFTEPNPFNPAGNLRPGDVAALVSADLTAEGPGPHLAREMDGSVLVPLFSDLKRHDMGEVLDTEQLVQAGVPTEQWLTRKLWGTANEPPFLHHGRATLLSEAIVAHGGEAEASAAAYAALSPDDQSAIVEFLKTLRVLPEDATSLEIAGPGSGVVGDEPAVARHFNQSDIDAGRLTLEDLIDHGRDLFTASFNTLDGQGRPEATGTGAVRLRREPPQNFNRISAPDANSCAGCHNAPRAGGGGDNVANVFVLGQRLPFVNFDGGEGDDFERHTLKDVANERNTLGMFGAGYIELLAREMTRDLQRIRDDALALAASRGVVVTLALETKGVSFGEIRATPAGSLDTSRVEGVDADLVVKPFHQKGAVVSIREFSNNAFNHHHGMQSAERFGSGVDHDRDGVANELTVGDLTAATIFQASLPVPGRRWPVDSGRRLAAVRGEARFAAIGCATCHVPRLRLEDPIFTEPNPFNPPGNLRPADVASAFSFNLTLDGPPPRLPREADGSVWVPAFTDLKRHDLGPDLDNELLEQAGIPTEEWLTRKLWGMANEPPFLHHGRALTIREAIVLHGGEAVASRDAFLALPEGYQREVVDFLKTLQVLPEGTETLQIFANEGVAN